ncbi:MAG: aminotransferase class I/II-fold pyridoxal phosphate-dependent enzyme [Ethanoligenens sp.]
MVNENYGFDTVKIRGGYRSEEHNHSVSVPIYQTAAFDLGGTDRADRLFSSEESGFIYSRLGNPTVAALEERVADLDGAAASIAVSSGMAAITYTFLNIAEGGGRILTTPRVYGGTFDSFQKIYPNFGIQVDTVEDADNPDAFDSAVRPDTKAVFLETISNPGATIPDLEKIAQIAHDHGIPLIVDNTVATPYLLRPIEYGADLIIYSATKAFSGHGNVIAGLIVESGKFNWKSGIFPQFEQPYFNLKDRNGRYRSFTEVFPDSPFTARIRAIYLNLFGASLSPFDAWLVLLGIETLSERVKKQVANTKEIIYFLEHNENVQWLSHPSAFGSPYRHLAQKYFPKGAGSILSFGLKGTEQQRNTFIESLKLFSYHTNIGDARSLVINSPKTTHSEMTPKQQKKAGIPPETIRLSIGLEDPADLISDLKQAIRQAFSS